MKCLPHARLLWLAGALGLAVLVPAASQNDGGRGQRRGGGGQQPAPTFQTTVPAHPVDIILGRPTDRSVTASVLSYTEATGYLEWGSSANEFTAHTPTLRLPAGEPVIFTLADLAPDTGYTYRLRYRAGTGDFAVGDAHRCHTRRAPGSAFTFTIVADSHLDERTETTLYTTTLRNALADQPDFHIDLGDTFMCDKVRPMGLPIAAMYKAQRYYFGLLCASAPLFYVVGNHDGESGGRDPEAVALRQKAVPNPLPDGFYTGNTTAPLGNYYAWEWGDALFIVLDPFTYSPDRVRTAEENWGRTLGAAQYRWLQQTLERSRASLKFVFLHHLVGGVDKNGRGGVEAVPFFEWGGRNLDGSAQFATRRPGWALPIHDLLVKHRVAAVFHGHDHFYARQEKDGIVYQEVPQPGWAGGERANQATEYGYQSGQFLASSGHLRVQVAPRRATVSYVRAYRPQDETGERRNQKVGASYELLAK